MAKRKKRRSHTTKRNQARARARARRRRFERNVRRSTAKNRRKMHYAWEACKRHCYTLFNYGCITTGNALKYIIHTLEERVEPKEELELNAVLERLIDAICIRV